MFEYIFGIDKGVPIDIRLDFGEIIITRLFTRACFFQKSCQFLLLSTTILNDTYMAIDTHHNYAATLQQ